MHASSTRTWRDRDEKACIISRLATYMSCAFFSSNLSLMYRIAINDVAFIECAVVNRMSRHICCSVIPPLYSLLIPFLLDVQVNEDDGHKPPVGM